ncbi:MAG: DUF4157 domain-containing protein [Pyrinomonadaceae bacterium]
MPEGPEYQHLQINDDPNRKTNTTTLPLPFQHQMETSFGKDLSDVRIHVGHEATLMNAQAFTRGNDVYFAPGKYNPYSESGQEIIAHELTHVVQQK